MGEASEIDLDRLAGCLAQADDGGGDREILQADAGAVEQGDLVGAGRGRGGSPLMTAPIWVIAASAIRPAATACCASPIDDRLGDLVGEDGGRGEERGLDLLLALGVGAHAGEVGAGLDLGAPSGSGRSWR